MCGDAIDSLEDGTIITGAWRGRNQIEVWNFKTPRKVRETHMWDGNE